MKCCPKCEQDKDESEFSKSKNAKDGLQPKCKKCENNNYKKFKQKNPNYIKEHYNKNKEQYNIWNKNWIKDNPERYQSFLKEYREKNLEKIRKYNLNWVKYKYHNDPNFKIKHVLRSSLRIYLKKSRIDKTSSISKLLGCSWNKFKNFLESQFHPEMNWNNWGDVWEIDHIKPCSSFDLTKLKEQQKCFHFTNLQPLFKTTKIAKELGYNEMGNRNKKDKLVMNGLLFNRKTRTT